jgi:tetratricopeptide (TPR) repeat protein
LTELDIKRKASELLQKGRYDDAIAEYQALLDSARKPNPAVLNLIGDIHIKQGNLERGFDSFLTASRVYTEEGLFHNAIAVGKKILRLDRDQVEVYGMLGSLYARQGLGMDCVKFLTEYARRKDEAGEYPTALAAFAEACETLSEFPEVHVAYADLLERVDRNDDAAACWDAAAQAWVDRGQPEEAEECRRKAAQLRGEELGESLGDSDTQDVSQLMNLRSLDNGPATPAPTPPATPEPVADSARDEFWGRQEEPTGLSEAPGAPTAATPPAATPPPTPPDPTSAAGESGEVAWQVFDPQAHPNLPPPPPLPGETPPAEPAAPTPIAPAAEGPPSSEVPRPEMPAEETPTAEAPEEMPTAEESLSELPGIILPPTADVPAAGAAAPPAETAEPVAATPPPAAEPTPPEPETAPVAGSGSGLQEAPELQEFFEQAAADNSEQAVVIGDDFELLREGGDVFEVISDFRDATMEILDLDDHQAHFDLGTTYMEMELFDEAAAEFEIAARGGDFALPAREMLGYCFLRKGQIDLAIKELESGLAIPDADDRDKLGLLYNLGIACGVLDQEEKAIRHFQRILELDPDFRDTQSRLERLVQNSH